MDRIVRGRGGGAQEKVQPAKTLVSIPADSRADGWMKLAEEFTPGEPDVTANVSNQFKDPANRPASWSQMERFP